MLTKLVQKSTIFLLIISLMVLAALTGLLMGQIFQPQINGHLESFFQNGINSLYYLKSLG